MINAHINLFVGNHHDVLSGAPRAFAKSTGRTDTRQVRAAVGSISPRPKNRGKLGISCMSSEADDARPEAPKKTGTPDIDCGANTKTRRKFRLRCMSSESCDGSPAIGMPGMSSVAGVKSPRKNGATSMSGMAQLASVQGLGGAAGLVGTAGLLGAAPLVSQACVDVHVVTDVADLSGVADITGVADVSGVSGAAGGVVDGAPGYLCIKCGQKLKTREELDIHSKSCACSY